MTLITPASAGPASSSPLDLLYPINFCLVKGIPNKPQQKHGLGAGVGLLKPFFLRERNLALGSTMVHIHTSYSVRMKDFLLIN